MANDKPVTGKTPRKPAAKRQPKKPAQPLASHTAELQANDKPEKSTPAKKTASKATATRQSDKEKPAAPVAAKAPAKGKAKAASRTPVAQQNDSAGKAKAPSKKASRSTVARKPTASGAPVDEAKKPRVRRKPSPKAAPAVDDDTVPPDDPFMGCTSREARFIDLWVACHNGTQAYRAAGYAAASDQVAAVCASQLLRKPKVQPYLAKRKAELYAATETQRDRLLGTIVEASFADPRELSRYEYRACRYCWDEQHRYQYTPAELLRAKEKYEQDKAGFVIVNGAGSGDKYPAFDEQGGPTYNGRLDANPECPECFGEGRGRLRIGDTRHLSPAALALYAGIEEGKDGIKIRHADQAKYRELLGRVVGLLDDERDLNLSIRASEEDLDKLYEAARAEARKNREAMRERAERLAAEEAERDSQ